MLRSAAATSTLSSSANPTGVSIRCKIDASLSSGTPIRLKTVPDDKQTPITISTISRTRPIRGAWRRAGRGSGRGHEEQGPVAPAFPQVTVRVGVLVALDTDVAKPVRSAEHRTRPQPALQLCFAVPCARRESDHSTRRSPIPSRPVAVQDHHCPSGTGPHQRHGQLPRRPRRTRSRRHRRTGSPPGHLDARRRGRTPGSHLISIRIPVSTTRRSRVSPPPSAEAGPDLAAPTTGMADCATEAPVRTCWA